MSNFLSDPSNEDDALFLNKRKDTQQLISDALAAMTGMGSLDQGSGTQTADLSSQSPVGPLAAQVQQAAQQSSRPTPLPGNPSEQAALDWIIQHESSGDVHAKNPKSTAFGLGQLLDYNRASYAKKLGISDPNTTDRSQQLAMMQQYIKERYGDAVKAKDFWQRHNWY